MSSSFSGTQKPQAAQKQYDTKKKKKERKREREKSAED